MLPEPEVPYFVGGLSASNSKTTGVIDISISMLPIGFWIKVVISNSLVARIVMVAWPSF